MKPIPFDEKFHEYLNRWIRSNAARYPDPEDMEAQLPEVYLRFINQPFPWLDGWSPAGYFASFAAPEQLIDLLKAYEEADMAAPDLLTERLAALGEASVLPLMALVNDPSACSGLRTTALNILIEIGTDAPMADCLNLVDRGEPGELADVAAELLQSLGEKPVPEMLKRLEGAEPRALATYLDLLCNFPGDRRIYEYTMREFLQRTGERAMFASFLGKLGDPRAIDALRMVMGMEDINYLDYLEIANAIEMLGGEAGDRDRDFSGDPYYESLRDM